MSLPVIRCPNELIFMIWHRKLHITSCTKEYPLFSNSGRQQFVQQPTNDFFNFGGFNFSDEFNAALDNQLSLNTSLLSAPVVSSSSSPIAPLGHCSSQQMVNSIVGLPSPPISSPNQMSLPSPPSYTNDSIDSPPGTPFTSITDRGTPGPSPSFHGFHAHSPGSSSSIVSQATHRRHSSGSSVNEISGIPSLQVRVGVLQNRVSNLMFSFLDPTLQTQKLKPNTKSTMSFLPYTFFPFQQPIQKTLIITKCDAAQLHHFLNFLFHFSYLLNLASKTLLLCFIAKRFYYRMRERTPPCIFKLYLHFRKKVHTPILNINFSLFLHNSLVFQTMHLLNLSMEGMVLKTPSPPDHPSDPLTPQRKMRHPEVIMLIHPIVVQTALAQRVRLQENAVENSAVEFAERHSLSKDYLTDILNATRTLSATCAPSVVKVSTTLSTSSVTPELIQVRTHLQSLVFLQNCPLCSSNMHQHLLLNILTNYYVFLLL